MNKVVARYNINQWGPPPEIVIEGRPDQRIRVGEAVMVALPPIWNRKGQKMPRLTFTLEVRKREEEGTMQDFVFSIQSNLQKYKDFWDKRKTEARTGVFLP